jgi:hypothetical protein
MHHLLRNELSAELRSRSLQVLVLDERGHATRAGAEVRLYSAGTNTLLGTGILDTGSGYNSQNVLPVHFGLANSNKVDIEITSLTPNGRVAIRLPGVDPTEYVGQTIEVKVNKEGQIVP